MTAPAKDSNPAMVAARNSWRCVQAKDKQGWLDLMADSMVMEDPIGIAPTNPDGKGIQGKQAVSEFWDNTMSKVDIRIKTHESFAAGNESAHVLTLPVNFENGLETKVRGIFTYRLKDAGKVSNLRGYWSIDEMEMTQS